MAEAIEFPPPRPDPREALYHKLQSAPREHAEALLDGYEILQLLRNKGILELAKGLLGSGEKVLGVLSETMESGEAVTFFRNVVILTKILGGMSPEMLEDVENALSTSARLAQSHQPPGLFRLLSRLASGDSRRALGTAAAVLEALGRHLGEGSATEAQVGRPEKTFRHGA